MSTSPHVVGIAGSLRDDSYSRIALRHALEAAEDHGGSAELLDLQEYDLPVFDPDAEEPGDVAAFTAAVREADSVLLATPVYHGSFSSPLKTALDYCGFDEFQNTTVGLLCVSGGQFPITSLDHLRSVCRALNAWVIPHQAALPRVRNSFERGEFVDKDDAERVATLGQRAVEYSNIEPDPPCLESRENVGADD